MHKLTNVSRFVVALSILFFWLPHETTASERKSLIMSRTVNNGPVEIYTETFGNAEDVPVLLIAGAMAPAIFWETSFCESLAS